MEIERIETIEALLDFRSEWEELFERSQMKNIFLTFEWMSLWWKYLGKDCKPFILVFKENGKYLGIVPLMASKEKKFNFPIRKIEFLSSSDADRLDFITLDRKDEIIMELFKFFLKDYTGWDILEFSNIPDFSNTIEILEDGAEFSGLFLEKRFCQKTFYINCDGEGKLPYIPSLKGLKKDLRKVKNRLLRLGFEARFERFSESEFLKKLFQVIIDIENRSWKGRSIVGIFSNKERIIFHNKLIEALAQKGMLEVAILRLDKKIVAYSYNFKFDSVCQGYNMAYLPEYSHLSPGALLIYLLIEDFFLNGGKEFDFLRGDEPWKYRWTNLYRRHFKIRIFNKNLYGKLLCLCQQFKNILKNPYDLANKNL